MIREESRRAARLAKKLKAEGKTLEEVSAELYEKGFTGKGGNAYSRAGVSWLVNLKSVRASQSRANGASRKQKADNGTRLSGMLSILKSDLDPEERIALAILLGEG